jgi:hypothetical protein
MEEVMRSAYRVLVVKTAGTRQFGRPIIIIIIMMMMMMMIIIIIIIIIIVYLISILLHFLKLITD